MESTGSTLGHSHREQHTCFPTQAQTITCSTADYKQGVEKWDTDSDTDASDDEADLAV